MKSPTCSCKFDQTLGTLQVPSVQSGTEDELSLEDILSLDWGVSIMISKTRNCPRCFADLEVMMTIQSSIENVLNLLEAAQAAYNTRKDTRSRRSMSRDDSVTRRTMQIKRGPRLKEAKFTLGRVVLNEDDGNMIAQKLIVTAIARKAGLIRHLRYRMSRGVHGLENMPGTDTRYYNLSRQGREAYDELDGKMATTSARVCSAVARARMS
ncbi:hypothetical protein LZ30DRAFT_753784 [Colletotrichum cereale]|nr:hypothetical protein LZ30DRAFT_753784 [Colletotrichum cereale]